MNNRKYDFSSVQINVPNPLAKNILIWSRDHLPDDEIFKNPDDPSFGREDEMHVTILYGLHSEKPDETKKLLQKEGPIKVRLGKTEIFTNSDQFDVLHIHVISPDLRKLNRILRNNVTYTNKYSEYRPHVTLAYMEKGKGWKYRGDDKWLDKTFKCNKFIFSSRNGTKQEITFK